MTDDRKAAALHSLLVDQAWRSGMTRTEVSAVCQFRSENGEQTWGPWKCLDEEEDILVFNFLKRMCSGNTYAMPVDRSGWIYLHYYDKLKSAPHFVIDVDSAL